MAADDHIDASDPADTGHAASLLYIVGRINHGIGREIRSRLAPWGLSVQEFTALSVLDFRPGLSNAQLARRAMVAPQSMIEILSKLETRGLVVRGADPSHGRILRASLTTAGAELIAEADRAVREIETELFGDASPEQRAATLLLLRNVMEKLSLRNKQRTEG